MKLAELTSAPLLAPATFLGYQAFDDDEPPLELWTLTVDIPDHPEGSTVSRQTLEKAGYVVPQPFNSTGDPCNEPVGGNPPWTTSLNSMR